ncbi:hypothetical protein GCM10009596_31810 [Arthrobacter rhombi]
MIPEAQNPGDGTLVGLDKEWVRDVRLYWQRWKLDSPALARVTEAVLTAARSSGSSRGPRVDPG